MHLKIAALIRWDHIVLVVADTAVELASFPAVAYTVQALVSVL